MYLPPLFTENNIAVLHDLIQQHSFATVISQHQGHTFANHLPILLKRDNGHAGTLVGHMARANPQWQEFSAGPEILVIFQGPHTYISPTWYQELLNVPTWNYVAVHVYGTPALMPQDKLYSLIKENCRNF